MVKTKKPLDEAFHRAVTNTLAGRSPYAIARDAGLPFQSIVRVLEGTDPHLSRAIEIADALGFKICYAWPRDEATDRGVETRRRAARLAASVMLLRPEFREILASPRIGVFVEQFAALQEGFARDLGPTRTDDPDRKFIKHLETIEHQKAAQAEREATETDE